MTPEGVEDAYRQCEEITREQARNFSYGIRLLPPDKRRALSAVYAFARRVDDIGDGELPAEEKLSQLKQARVQVRSPERFGDDPVLVALADAARRLPVPLDAFEELIDGCEQDVRETAYPDFDTLVGYCRNVAGSIGRLTIGVCNPPDLRTDGAEVDRLAYALGVALQLTNILRDVREDFGRGRVYLPAEDLATFSCEIRANDAGDIHPQEGRFARLIRFEAMRAEEWYADGLRLLARLDRRSAACCGAMAGIYHRLLGRIAAAPEAVLTERVSLSGREKLAVAGSALLRRGR